MKPTSDKIELADILDASTNGVLVVDSRGCILYENRQMHDYYRLERGACVGLPVGDLIPQLEATSTNCIRSGEAHIGLQLEANGIAAVANISPIIKQGEAVGASISLKRMDEYEQLAETLESYKKQNKLLQAIFNASTDGLWIIDAKGTVVAWNPAAEAITGFTADEIVGKQYDELAAIGIEKKDVRHIREAVETKRRVSTFNIHPRSHKQVLGNATPVFDDSENVLWVVGNEHDLSELNGLKEELDDALKATEKAKAELAGLNLLELRDQEIIAESKAMIQVLQVAVKLAKIEASHILITGESGTGKGFLAKLIHNKSARASQPFIQINCAAVPENLLEAELFGYEKGAFTGARDRGKAGLIELAQNGTLFLDEIGDRPMRLQAKLLKYLDDHEVMRLGSIKARKIDCAIVSATNQNLEALVEEKRFRQDLFFRLNNFQLHIPPLRERAEDILELVHFFLRKYNKQYKRRKRISAKAIETLQAYAFPGNVRELQSLCKQAVLMSDDTFLDGYFADNLQIVCAPVGLSQPEPPAGSDNTEAPVAGTSDAAAWIAAWLVKILNIRPSPGAAKPGAEPDFEPLPLTQILQHVVALGRMIYSETHRQNAGPAPPPASPPPSEQEDEDTAEAVVNLTAALDAREREIFLHATQHCRTIRELAEYLQTSPATALRKLKKHGLSL